MCIRDREKIFQAIGDMTTTMLLMGSGLSLIHIFRNKKNINSFLKLYRSSEPNWQLEQQELEEHQYCFLPEEYIPSKSFDFEEIPSRKKSLHALWSELQKNQDSRLYEDHYGQTSTFNTAQCVSTRKGQLKKLIQTGYGLLECELLLLSLIHI